MGTRLAHKVAAVTGGASGMGKATVMRYLEEGARVVRAELNKETMAQASAEALAAGYGADVLAAVRADVSAEADVAGIVDAAV